MKEHQLQVVIDLIDDITIEDDPRPIKVLARCAARKQQEGRTLKAYRKAMNRLTDNADIEVIGRKQQSLQILEFLENAVRAQGCPQLLHISGVPGLGKSLTTLRSVWQLTQTHSPFILPILLNIMSLKTPQSIYQHLLTRITSFSRRFINPLQTLEQYFRSPANLPQRYLSQIHSIKLIVIDEMDELLSMKKVLYNLLEWAAQSGSRIVLVGISNGGFEDRVEAKERSRMGSEHIIFRPYSYEELLEILKVKLGDSIEIFEENVLEMMCKRVSNQSADVRSLLNMCAEAVQSAKNQLSDSSRTLFPKVCPHHLHIDPPNITTFLSNLPLRHKLLLLTLYRTSNTPQPLQSDISHNFTDILNTLLQKHQLIQTNFSLILRWLFSLRDQNIVAIDRQKKDNAIMFGEWSVRLEVDIRECEDDEVLREGISVVQTQQQQ